MSDAHDPEEQHGSAPDDAPPDGSATASGADRAAPDIDEDPEAAISALEVDVELLLKEREEYLLLSQQLQADFENYKKRMLKQQTEHVERAAGVLVERLLPVLDNFDLALAHGETGVEAVYRSLLTVLEAEGLERLEPMGKPFDPNEHEAVVHEPAAAGDDPGASVSEVLRPGYRWKGRLLRPAMVKVRG
jgi:molecular chaperone GrpE